MYTKTNGHQLLVNNLYAEGKTAIHTNSFLHGLKYLYNAILQLIISLEKFCGYQLFCENRETFPPRTICNIQYVLQVLVNKSELHSKIYFV